MLTGGAGADEFRFLYWYSDPNKGTMDTINGLSRAQGDRVTLSNLSSIGNNHAGRGTLSIVNGTDWGDSKDNAFAGGVHSAVPVKGTAAGDSYLYVDINRDGGWQGGPSGHDHMIILRNTTNITAADISMTFKY